MSMLLARSRILVYKLLGLLADSAPSALIGGILRQDNNRQLGTAIKFDQSITCRD